VLIKELQPRLEQVSAISSSRSHHDD